MTEEQKLTAQRMKRIYEKINPFHKLTFHISLDNLVKGYQVEDSTFNREAFEAVIFAQ